MARTLGRALAAVETWRWVDRPAQRAQWVLRRILPEGPLLRALHGTWLGHALHPALAPLPLAFWLSTGLLDLTGDRTAARRLVLSGVVCALPTAVAGLSELRDLDGPRRRVGYVHLVLNITATACYLTSWRQRRQGRDVAGRAWATAGLLAVNLGAALGGHLAHALETGTGRRGDATAPQFVPERETAVAAVGAHR